MSEANEQFGIWNVYEALDAQQEGFEMFEEIREGVKAAIAYVGIDSERKWRACPPVMILRECQAYQENIVEQAKQGTKEKLDYERKVFVNLIVLTRRIRDHIKDLKNEDGES